MSDNFQTNNFDSPINENASFNTQLTYSFINNNLFYPLVPKPYYHYYNKFVRQNFYWYDGFNPFFHNAESGIFSTRLPKIIVDKLAGLVNGGKLMYDPAKELSDYKYKVDDEDLNALQFTEYWDKLVDFSNKNETAIKYAMVGGDSTIKLNSDGENLYPTVFRKDNYFLDIDFKGKITKWTGVVYTHTKTNKQTQNSNESEDWYYLLEERSYDDDGNPQYRIYVKAGFGNLTTNKAIDFNKVQEVPFDKLPKTFVKDLKNMYPDVKLDTFMPLPLKTLGIFMYKASDGISNMPQLPFGESLFSGLWSYFQGFDYAYSNFITDQYIGRASVMIPKPMQSPEKEVRGAYSGLDKRIYTLIDYLDPNQQKPQPNQFDLRVEEWTRARNYILQLIAMHLGISNRTLSNFLEEGVEKATAREISVDDATSTFVTNQRNLYCIPINEILDELMYYYEFDDKVKVRFSRVGLHNMNDVVQQVVTLKQNGLVDPKTALEMIYVDKNEKEIMEMLERIEEYEKKQQENDVKSQEPKDLGTSDEDYEETNNNDINHIEED